MEKLPVLKAAARALFGAHDMRVLLDRLRRLSGKSREGRWSCAQPSYFYGVWMKHLVLLHAHGMTALPEFLVEFGPGDSLGVGLAALLCGVKQYRGYDTANYTEPHREQVILRQLAESLHAREPRPQKGWPDFDQYLDSTLFPGRILSRAALLEALDGKRVAQLSHAVGQGYEDSGDSPIQLVAPWQDTAREFKPECDVVMSHTVLQYMPDLKEYFSRVMALLKPGGWTSHQVDFSSMGLTSAWNGHLAYDERVWKLMVRHRPFYASRLLLPDYLEALTAAGFVIVAVHKRFDRSGLKRADVAECFRSATEEDIQCAGAFLIARKPG